MTDRHRQCEYAIYYNKMNPHVIIHKIDCKHLGKHGEEHEQQQGGYGYFVKKYEVIEFAKGLGGSEKLPSAKYCNHCWRENRSGKK